MGYGAGFSNSSETAPQPQSLMRYWFVRKKGFTEAGLGQLGILMGKTNWTRLTSYTKPTIDGLNRPKSEGQSYKLKALQGNSSLISEGRGGGYFNRSKNHKLGKMDNCLPQDSGLLTSYRRLKANHQLVEDIYHTYNQPRIRIQNILQCLLFSFLKTQHTYFAYRQIGKGKLNFSEDEVALKL